MNNINNETKFTCIVNYKDSELETEAKIIIQGSYTQDTSSNDAEKINKIIEKSISEYIKENNLKKLKTIISEKDNIIEYCIFKTKEYKITNINITSIDYDEESKQLILNKKKEKKNEPKIVKTDVDAKDGQNKCPKCGSTDIVTNTNNGKLRCMYCRHEFEPEKITGMETDLSKLEGQIIGSGASNIIASTNDVLTFKCSSCGAEVVIDTSETTNARCHWCRNVLSVNEQIPNGSIPDVVLPFTVNKETAKSEIEKFVGKRKFFANPKFKQEFTAENIMGVYFPYLLVDANAHANLIGEGEHLVRKYYVKEGDNQKAYYDADLYHVEREFDITISELSVESSSDRLNKKSQDKTNNIINSIMPFDTENCVKYNANYLRGYTSEKRDMNIDELRNLVATQSRDIVRFAANDTLKYYDRGVTWKKEDFKLKGQQWKAAYLPVWLYSYQEVKGEKKLLHYVAVNARTKETMGSVPIHMPKLLLISILIEILGILGMVATSDSEYNWIFLTPGIIFFIVMYSKYRNSGARHKYETETKKEISNLRKTDDFIKHEKGLSNSKMTGSNNTSINGSNMDITSSVKNIGTNILNSSIDNNSLASFIKDNIDKNIK